MHARGRLATATVLMATALAMSLGSESVAASDPGTPGYLDLDGMSVWQEGARGVLWFLVDAKGAIPRFPDPRLDSEPFGYVWLTRTEWVGYPDLVSVSIAFLAEFHPVRGWYLFSAIGASRSADATCAGGTVGIVLHDMVGPFRVQLTAWCWSADMSSSFGGGIAILGDTLRIMRPGGVPLSEILTVCNPDGECYERSYAVASYRRVR